MSAKQLPNGLWLFRFQYKKRDYRKFGFRTRAEAEKAEVVAKAEAIRRDSYSQSYNDNMKLCEAADLFFEEHSKPHKRSWKLDRAYIRVMNTYFGQRRIRDIGPRDVEAYCLYVRRTVKGIGGVKQISLHGVNHYHANLKAIISWAKKKRLYFGENPAWGVEMAKVPTARVRFLYPVEEKRLTPVVARRTRLWPYYVVALHTGMRLGEISAIRVQDVIMYPQPMIFIPNSKTQRSRHVPLHGLALDVVTERLKGKADRPDMRLLEAVHQATASLWFNDACREAKVEDFSFHCLRHTFAGHMLSKGTAIYLVSKMLGHSTISVTENHYGHLDKTVLFREIHNIDSVMTLPKVPTVDGLESAEAVNKPSVAELS